MNDSCKWMIIMYLLSVFFIFTLCMQGEILTNPSAEILASLETIGQSANGGPLGDFRIGTDSAFKLFLGITMLFGFGYTIMHSRAHN